MNACADRDQAGTPADLPSVVADEGYSPARLPMNYTVKQAAQVLNCCERTVYNLLDRGHLDSFNIGRLKRITGESVRRVALKGTAD